MWRRRLRGELDLWSDVADASIGLRRASRYKINVDKKTLQLSFTAVELQEKVTFVRDFSKNSRTSTAHRWRGSKENTSCLATV